MIGALLALVLGCLPAFVAASEAPVELAGPRIQGGLIIGHTEPSARVVFDGRVVRVSESGVFLIAFGRDEKPLVPLELTLGGERFEYGLEIEQRDYQVQRINGLKKRTVSPSEEDLERIRAEVALTKSARARDSVRTDFSNGFQWPLTGRITGVYGSQRILNGKPRRPHYGVDVSAPEGTTVLAPADGVVTLVHPDMFYSGGTLIVDHGHGLSSTFIHLSKILVSEGESVQTGQPIAEVGTTGRSTGPHLDWRMNWFDRRLDPQLLVGPMPRERK